MNIRSKVFGNGPAADDKPLIQAKKRPKGAKADMLDSIPVPREETVRGNTRGGDRHRLADQQVKIKHKGKNHDVTLVNVSGGGAMIEGDFEPRLWDKLHLHLGEGGSLECAVRWIKGRRVGLEFAHETRLDCRADEHADLLRAVIANSFPDVDFELPDAPAKDATDDEGRRERRHPLIWSGELHHDYQTSAVRLRNISATGAQIECFDVLRVGSEPLLDLGEAGSVFATVAWVVGDHAGLKFNAPFDLSQLARCQPDVASIDWDQPAYLKSAAAQGSPWDEQWGRMSLGELRSELEGFLKY